MKKFFLICVSSVSICGSAQVFNGVYADTNNNILPGFYISSTQVVGTVLTASLPGNVITTSNTNLSVLFTNTSTASFSLLSTNGHFKFRDEYGTTNDFTTNGYAITWTNGNYFSVSNGAVRFSGLGTGNGAGFTNLSVVNFSNWPAISNTLALNYTNAVVPLSNSYVAFTNWITTNTATNLFNVSNSLATTFTNQIYNTSNSLAGTVAYNLYTLSNTLAITTASAQAYAVGVSNTVVTSSNGLAAAISSAVGYTTSVSNLFSGITASKALTATVPATYSSIGIGFSTPLLPDGNYSVTLLPQDQNTAQSPAAGLFWWVGSKNASGFTIYLSYATNGYNLNFDCLVKENTQ